MAQNVTIAGASYNDVPAIEVPKQGTGTAIFCDPSVTTAVASDVASGKYFLAADGTLTAGTASGATAITIEETTDSSGGTCKNIVAVDLTGDTVDAAHLLSGYTAHDAGGNAITGSYVAPTKNVQVVQGTTRTSASTMTAIGAELTVSKTGTYDIYYSAFRTNTSTSYTWATQLYIDGVAYGSEDKTWTNNQQNTHLTNISLTVGQKLRVYGRNTRGTSYYVCAPIVES